MEVAKMENNFVIHNPLVKLKYRILFLIFCILLLANVFILKSSYLWYGLLISCYIFRKRFFLIMLELTYFNLIKFLQLFFKQDTILLIDCESKCELIDCYSMFEYLQEKSIKSYYIIYSTQPQLNEILKKYGKNVIVIRHQKLIHFSLFFKLIKTKHFLSSFASGTKILKALLRTNSNIDYVFMQHGVVYLKYSIFDSYNSANFDRVIVSNRIEAEIWKKYGGFSENNIIIAGLSRWDLLKNIESPKEKSIFIFFTWRRTFAEKDYMDSKYYKNIISLLNNKNLKNILKENNIKIYYGVHHALLNEHTKDFIIDSKNIEIVKIENVSEYVRKCNLLITDFSSISFDFLFQNKPVIYYLLDRNDKFLNEIDLAAEENAFLQLENLFNRCSDESEVLNLIELYLKNDFKLESEKHESIDRFFNYKENIREKIYGRL